MSPEIIAALVGLFGVIIGAVPTYLFVRQRGVAEIDKLKAETDKTRAEAEKIRSELQGIQKTNSYASVSFVPIQKGEYKYALKDLTKLIASAKQELLVLDYTPLAERNNETRFYHDEVTNDERRQYYEETLDKIRNVENNTFRYRRIIQVPKGRQASELFFDDPIFREHCETVIKISETRPEIASIKIGKVLYRGTIMIIDQRILI